MNLLALAALSFGMSMDAFAAALAKGSTRSKEKSDFLSALKIGLVFGVIEAITPMIGYFFGVMAEGLVSRYDHWLSFILLSLLGVSVIYNALFGKEDIEIPKSTHWRGTVLTAFATSIDAMVIGVSLAFLGVNILLASVMIGVATTVMATLGVYLGAKIGLKVGKVAEVAGGFILLGIGGFILLSHLGYL